MKYSVVFKMPVIYQCKSCNHILFSFERVGQDCYGVPTPMELSIKIGGKCPNCGRKLDIPKLDDILVVGRVKRFVALGKPHYTELLSEILHERGSGKEVLTEVSEVLASAET